METDREILLWFHQRLVHQHKESELVDYMRRLRWIIMSQEPGKTSRGQQAKFRGCCNNSVSEIKLRKKTEFEKQLLKEQEGGNV